MSGDVKNQYVGTSSGNKRLKLDCSFKLNSSNEHQIPKGDKIYGDGGADIVCSDGNKQLQDKKNDLKNYGKVEVGCESSHVIPVNFVLSKIPPEVWETIFGYLKNPQDQYSVVNSCPEWHCLMASKRTNILFPLVIPHFAQYLSPSATLNLRLVNKNWRHSIDSHLQNHATSKENFESHWWHTDSPFNSILKHIEKSHNLQSRHEIHHYTEIFSSSHPPNQNPFISRQLTLQFERGPNNFRASHDAGVGLLKTYGQHIWEFTHHCPTIGGDEVLAVQLLPSLLTNLKNLKYLKIDWSSDAAIRVPPETLRNLRASNELQLPPLSHLTSLNFDFRGGDELGYALGICLLKAYGPQLETFVCCGEFLEHELMTPEIVWKFLPNLKNLRIFSVTSGCLQKLASLQEFPLQRLQLWYSYQAMQFKSLVKAINSFSKTLELLNIDVKVNYPLSLSPPFSNKTPEYFNVDAEEVSRPFPKLTTLSAPASSINSPWFWKMVKLKFHGMKVLKFQTAMETLFAPFERKYLEREVEESRRFFNYLQKLNVIKFWFYNQGGLVLRRQ